KPRVFARIIGWHLLSILSDHISPTGERAIARMTSKPEDRLRRRRDLTFSRCTPPTSLAVPIALRFCRFIGNSSPIEIRFPIQSRAPCPSLRGGTQVTRQLQ